MTTTPMHLKHLRSNWWEVLVLYMQWCSVLELMHPNLLSSVQERGTKWADHLSDQ